MYNTYLNIPNIVLGVTALFFWVATKVHQHNALFVYCQRCEGGGKIFYYWNRIVFLTLYSSIVIFSAILALKNHAELGLAFLFIMLIITYCVDSKCVSMALHLRICSTSSQIKHFFLVLCIQNLLRIPLLCILSIYQ